MFYGTWWALLPPVIAIVLALITKQVYLSLFAGVVVGSFLCANGAPWEAFEVFVQTLIENTDLTILLFLILISIVICLIQMSGGARAYGNWAVRHMKSKRTAMLSTSLLGCIIFMDDGFNCLTVGSVMMPVTDKFKVSRAKLAYIIDATAAPVCILAPISSWAAAINSYVPEGANINGFEMFVRAIPFNFYAILTLVMVFFTSAASFDFGLMKKFEDAAARGKKGENVGAAADAGGELEVSRRGKVVDLILPMVFLIVVAIAAMIYTGYLNGGTSLLECFANCESAKSLVFASLMTILFCLALYLPRRVLSFDRFMTAIPEGAKLMMPFIVILVLAWTLKGLISTLGLDVFISSVLHMTDDIEWVMPLLLFLVSVFVSFSSGTSWGTFAIMIPIAVSIPWTSPVMLVMAISACLSGGVTGDHISPISDTTIMSSTGAKANHIDHVRTQIQYQLPVISAAAVGFVVAGLTRAWYIALPVSVVLLGGILFSIRVSARWSK